MIPLNVQPKEKAEIDALGWVDVSEIFYTIQGEGPFAGTPAVFVRLAGCNLQCPGCDTDYTSNRVRMSPNGVLSAVLEQFIYRFPQFGTKLVVITGGEPFRQKLTRVVPVLLQQSFTVQIETNGTLFDSEFPYHRVTTVISPKTRINPAYKDLAVKIGQVYFKYVARSQDLSAHDGLPDTALGSNSPLDRPWSTELSAADRAMLYDRVYLQPMDEQNEHNNKVNLNAVAESCMRNGYKLSLQMHKIVGLR